jgi:hypothetical protein
MKPDREKSDNRHVVRITLSGIGHELATRGNSTRNIVAASGPRMARNSLDRPRIGCTTRFFARREPSTIYLVVESSRAERNEDIPYRVSVILKKAIKYYSRLAVGTV